MYVRISPPAVATRSSEGEKTASFTDPACAFSNPRTSDRFAHPCQVTLRRKVFQCIHSYIHTVLSLTLYCIKFCTILSLAEFFSRSFSLHRLRFLDGATCCSVWALSTFVLLSGFCIQEVFFSGAGRVQQGCKREGSSPAAVEVRWIPNLPHAFFLLFLLFLSLGIFFFVTIAVDRRIGVHRCEDFDILGGRLPAHGRHDLCCGEKLLFWLLVCDYFLADEIHGGSQDRVRLAQFVRVVWLDA